MVYRSKKTPSSYSWRKDILELTRQIRLDENNECEEAESEDDRDEEVHKELRDVIFFKVINCSVQVCTLLHETDEDDNDDDVLTDVSDEF